MRYSVCQPLEFDDKFEIRCAHANRFFAEIRMKKREGRLKHTLLFIFKMIISRLPQLNDRIVTRPLRLRLLLHLKSHPLLSRLIKCSRRHE